MQRSDPADARFFRALNRFVEPLVRRGVASPGVTPAGLIVLETRGRLTGRRSRRPLAALRICDHIVVSTFRGRRSSWVKDCAADPRVRFWVDGRPRKGRALLISADGAPPAGGRTPSWLARIRPLLAPYTRAGWAFALVVPE